MVDVKKMLERFEQVYQEEKNKEAEELYNALADVIAQKKATIQNILFVLRMIEFQLLKDKYEQLMGATSKKTGEE